MLTTFAFTNQAINVIVGFILCGLLIWSLRTINEVVNSVRRWYRWQRYGKPRYERGREMVRRAREYVNMHGPIAVRNRAKKGVTAFARYDKFDTRLLEILRWTATARNADLMCRRVFVDVVPTFTFADNKAVLFPAHTGESSDAEDLANGLVLEVTGLSRADVDRKHFDEALSVLVVRDERLLIPFEFEEPTHTTESEFKRFGGTTLQQAEEELAPLKDQ